MQTNPLGREPVKPDAVLRDELRKRKVGTTAFARAVGCDPKWVSNFIAGRSSMDASDAIRFGRYFGTSPQFWLNMQRDVDLYQAYRRLNAHDRNSRNGKG